MQGPNDWQPILFLVLEVGAAWPQDFDCRGLTEVRVVVQQSEEATTALAGRVYERLLRAHEARDRIGVATLVLNDGFSHADFSLRCTIARLLTSTLLPKQPLELVLYARHAKPEWEAHLIALSQTLSDEIPSRVRLSLELGRAAGPMASHRSGVFARVDVSVSESRPTHPSPKRVTLAQAARTRA